MTSLGERLHFVKSILPLPQLFQKLGCVQLAEKSAPCPFHEDHSPSFSCYKSKTGDWRWKCHAGCGEGDEIDFLVKHQSLSKRDAIRKYIEMAGLDSHSSRPAIQQSPPSQKFSWKLCVKDFTKAFHQAICEERGYSAEFVAWLHSRQLIGNFKGSVAFPVSENDQVVRCHTRLPDKTWRYIPKGPSAPLIIGRLDEATNVFLFESQWDAFALMDLLQWHNHEGLSKTAIIVSRGAQNARGLLDGLQQEVKLYAVPQNDPKPKDGRLSPAEKWMNDLKEGVDRSIYRVAIPIEHKDLNDWSRAGLTSMELQSCISNAQVDEIVLPVEDMNDDCEEDGKPFPIHALPPVMREIVQEVAVVEKVPVVLPAAVALSVASASLGKGLEVCSGKGRKTRPNLFIILSARSGLGKSTVFAHLTGPFLDAEEATIEKWKQHIRPEAISEKRILEKEIQNLEKELTNKTNPIQREGLKQSLKEKYQKLDVLTAKLVCRKYVTEDVTIEALPKLMANNGEVLYSLSSDGRKVAQNILGRYNPGKQTDEAFYLKAYTGETFSEDRKEKDSIRLSKPCLSLLWLFQPDVLDDLFKEKSLHVGGFLPRCLVAHTNAKAMEMELETRGIDPMAEKEWKSLIHSLLEAFHDNPSPSGCEVAAEGLEAMRRHYNDNVRKQNGEYQDIDAFVSRWTEQAWRLGVVLHACKHLQNAPSIEVSLETIQEAIEIADWFSEGQLAILTKSRWTAFQKLAEEVLEYMKKRGKPIKARDLYHTVRICRSADESRQILEKMESRGMIQGEDSKPPGGGKITRYYRPL